MLKMTEIVLELISNIDMYLFFKKGMRGGISYIAKSFSKANNKYLQSYDVNIPNKFVMYLDENNLHKLHELHNDYSLAPENLEKLVIICCQIIVVALQINIA